MATRPEDQQLAYRNTDIGRRGNDSVRPGTVDDEILAHDLDTTTWSPPAAPPPGLTSTQGTGPDATTLRPGQYFDASGGVVYRTGDPDRDARLQADEARAQARITGSPGHRGFVGSTFEGPETRNKTAKEIEAERGGQVNGVRDLAQAAAGMPGETVQVESTRPDPMAIDALTRRYAVDAIDRAGPVTRYDAQGNALPPSEEDLAYQQSMAMDQTFQDRVEAMARERAVEEERARQRLPHQEQLTALTDDVTAEQARALSKYVAMRRDFWDKARRAQARADAAYPNPDDLLGGRGSWGRALALGIAAGGGPTGAALVNNALEMQAAGQGARYNRERQRASDALGNAEEAGREAGFETQTSNAILAAAKERVASQFDTIAAQTADQALQAKYQSMAADIRASYTKDLGSLATQMANRDLRESQLAMKGMHYDSKLHRWVSMFGDNGGGGAGGPGGPPGGVVASPTNPFGKSGVREPDRGGRPGGYWQAKDEDSAKKATEAGEEYIRLDDSLNDMQVIAREVQGAKSLGGQAWDRWKSENDARYKNALINGAQVAARVLHGRPPGKFTMQEVQEEFPDLARMWEANNVEGVIRSLRDTSDRQYNKAMHQYGYNGTYRSDRPTTAEPGNVNIYARDIVGDYVKGGSQGADFVHNAVGGGSDPTDRGALGKYVTSYLDNNIGDTNALVESLKTIMTKALGNRLKATQAGDRKGANAFQVIADAIKSQIAEVRSKKTQTDRERASMKSTVDAAQDPLRNPTVFP
jgi:hypothetical protein